MSFNDLMNLYGVDIEYLNVKYGIPIRTLQSWKRGERRPPVYLLNLLNYALQEGLKYGQK